MPELEADIARPNGRVVTYIEGALGNLGAILEADPTARARLQTAAEGIVRSLLPTAQVRIAEFIGSGGRELGHRNGCRPAGAAGR